MKVYSMNDLRQLYVRKNPFVREVILKAFEAHAKGKDIQHTHIMAFIEDAVPFCFIKMLNRRFFLNEERCDQYLAKQANKITLLYIKSGKTRPRPKFYERNEVTGILLYTLGKVIHFIETRYAYIVFFKKPGKAEFGYININEFPADILNRLIRTPRNMAKA